MKCPESQRLAFWLFVALSLSIAACKETAWKSGDLIFLDLDCGNLCEAIENVTLEQFDVKGPRLSHVGIIETEASATYVWEAWPVGGVRKTKIEEVLKRVKAGLNMEGGYRVGHFKMEHRETALSALFKIKSLQGKAYDSEFLWSNDSYYCSELVSLGFNWGARPMFYGKPGSSDYKIWRDYFAEMKKKVPQSLPGMSPLGIYLIGMNGYFETTP